MKSIAVNGSTGVIAGAILVAAVGVTWGIARARTPAEVGSLRGQVARCEERAAESVRLVKEALAGQGRENTRVQELIKENELLRQAAEKPEQQSIPSQADETRSSAIHARRKPSPLPQRMFELSPGEQQDIIPGVLDLTVDTIDPTSAEVRYGGFPRHLAVGQTVAISYLGRPCVLGLTAIKGSGDTQKGSFSFSVMEPARFVAEPEAPAEGPPQ